VAACRRRPGDLAACPPFVPADRAPTGATLEFFWEFFIGQTLANAHGRAEKSRPYHATKPPGSQCRQS